MRLSPPLFDDVSLLNGAPVRNDSVTKMTLWSIALCEVKTTAL